MTHKAIAAACRNRRVQVLAVFLLAALAAVFWVQTYHKANRPIGYDVHAYLDSATAMASGENPYRVDRPIWCLYPPFFAVAAIPLTWLPEPVVHGTWFLVNVAALLLTMRLVVTHSASFTGIAWNRSAIVPSAAVVLILLGPIQNHLLNGQCNLLILLICLAFWLAHERGRPASGGFYLALGASLKLVPAIFAPLLIIRRSWRALAWTTGFSVLFGLLPGLFLGSRLVDVYRFYFDVVLLGEARSGAFSSMHPHDFTAAGFLSWLLPLWSGSLAIRIAGAAMVVVPLLVVDARRRRSNPDQTASEAIGQGLWILSGFLAAILLISPMSETHHLVYLLPAVSIITLKAVGQPAWCTRWRVAAMALMVCLLYTGKGLEAPLQFAAIAGLYAACTYESCRPPIPLPDAATIATPGPRGAIKLTRAGADVWQRAS